MAAFLSRRAWCTVWAVGVLNSSAVRDGSLRLSIIIGLHVPSLSFHSSSLLLFSGDNDSDEKQAEEQGREYRNPDFPSGHSVAAVVVIGHIVIFVDLTSVPLLYIVSVVAHIYSLLL